MSAARDASAAPESVRDATPVVPTECLTARLRLEAFAPRHADAVADFMQRNDAHFRPWDPPRHAGETSAAALADAGARAERAWQEDREARWVILPLEAPDRVIGRIRLTAITRLAFQSCRPGYRLDAARQGEGLMSEALRAVIAYAFDALRLHRIEANYRPDNVLSGRVLARLGFVQTGVAPQYLFIDGTWRDHVQSQLVNAQFDPEWITGKVTAR